MTRLQIPPPVDTSWRNDVLAAEDAATILKIAPGSPDYDRLVQKAMAAGDAICLHLDRTDPIPGVTPGNPPNVLREAHANVTVELYRRKDAPFGVVNAWSPDDVAIRVSSDPLKGVYALIERYRTRWGLA